MKRFPYIYIIGVFLLVCCQKIDLPEKNSGKILDDAEQIVADTLTVAECLKVKTDSTVFVRGFYVGYISGTSLTNATFGIPDEKDNTNLLLADNPFETDYKSCLPVAISQDLRNEIGLFSHPEFFRMPILIYGTIETYFQVNGIRDIKHYRLLHNEELNPDNRRITIDILHTSPAPFEGR